MPLEAERIFGDYQRIYGRQTPSLDNPDATLLSIVGRLKPGISISQADERLRVLGAEVYKALPPVMDDRTGRPFPPGTLVARAMPNGMSRNYFSETVLLMTVMAGVALIIACANLGNLLLARATRRQGEIATRLALGATRGRLIRQLLTESVALAAAGAAVGLIVAHWGSEVLLSAISFPGEPTFLDLSWDTKLVAFTVGTTLLCALFFGLAPAIRATGLPLYSAMQNGLTTGNSRNRLSNAVLIVVQVALSVALLVSAGLLVRTVHALLAKDPGYEAKGVLVAGVDWAGTDESAQRQAFDGEELLEQFRSVPGVISASGSAPSGGMSLPTITISQPGESKRHPRGYNIFVTPGFFRTRRTPILSGRDFNDEDNKASLPVAILS
ncbi:MAG: FtsX-like permease family protein, partial [Candidatus Acidiferrum sp.]